jgi:hypothetical protein
MTSIIIDRRYCGPPNSGNGGYVCGRLARHIPGGAEVTLRVPPPLDKPLDVAAADDGSWQLRDGATVVASGRAARVELARLETASFDEACAAELLTPVKPHEHPLPTVPCAVLPGRRETACAFLPDRSCVNRGMPRPCSRRAGHRIRP